MTDLSCFKAYDIRGKVPDPLSPELAFALGRAVAEHFAARRVVLGYDARLAARCCTPRWPLACIRPGPGSSAWACAAPKRSTMPPPGRTSTPAS